MRLSVKCLFAALVVLAGALPAAAQRDACFDKGGLWDAEAETCAIQYGFQIDINYPVALAQQPVAERAIDDFLETRRSEFFAYFVEAGFAGPFGIPWSLIIDFAEYRFSENIVSVQFSIHEFTGGAHGNTFFQTFTFDLEQGREIALEELFRAKADPLATVAPIVREEIVAQLGDFALEEWVEDGTRAVPENYQHFAVSQDELLFFIPPYQVAPYAAGSLTVHIPLSQLAALLAPPFAGAD